MNGAKLIATNPDPNCPTLTGTRPGCGAIVAMLEKATGIEAFSVGKPSPVMMRAARKELELSTGQTIMVGDTMNTDILGGTQMGYNTALVLTGSTRREELKRFAYSPDFIADSVADLAEETFIERFGLKTHDLISNAKSAFDHALSRFEGAPFIPMSHTRAPGLKGIGLGTLGASVREQVWPAAGGREERAGCRVPCLCFRKHSPQAADRICPRNAWTWPPAWRPAIAPPGRTRIRVVLHNRPIKHGSPPLPTPARNS